MWAGGGRAARSNTTRLTQKDCVRRRGSEWCRVLQKDFEDGGEQLQVDALRIRVVRLLPRVADAYNREAVTIEPTRLHLLELLKRDECSLGQ